MYISLKTFFFYQNTIVYKYDLAEITQGETDLICYKYFVFDLISRSIFEVTNTQFCVLLSETYITTPEPIPNPCNSKQGFKPFGNSCFKFVTSPKSWTDASKYCSNQGAFLVTISSEFEQAFIRLMVDGTQTWTGLNDIKVTLNSFIILFCWIQVLLEVAYCTVAIFIS